MFLRFFTLIILFLVLSVQGIPPPPGPLGPAGPDARPQRGPVEAASVIAIEVATITRTVSTITTATSMPETQKKGGGGGLSSLQQEILIGAAIGCECLGSRVPHRVEDCPLTLIRPGVCMTAIAVAAFLTLKRRKAEQQRVRFSVVTPGLQNHFKPRPTRPRPTPRTITTLDISAPVLDSGAEKRSFDSSRKPAFPPGLDTGFVGKKIILPLIKKA